MFGMGMGEILLIAVVALLVLGPDRLPSAAKALGKGIRDLRSQTRDLQQTIEKDTELGDAVRELRGALRGDPETLYERATGQRFSDSKAPSKPPAIPAATSAEDGGGSESSATAPSAAKDASSADVASAATVASAAPSGPTPARPADTATDSEPPAESASSDSFDPVIRSAEGAVARSDIGEASGSDDSSHG